MERRTEEYAIIEECRNGNIEVYAVLVERYQEMVYNIAYRMLGDAETAKDIAQESFISAYGALKTFKNDSKFSTWLYSITMNKCRDHLRGHTATVPLYEITEMTPCGGLNPEEAMSRKQAVKELQAALALLPDVYREAVVLKHLEGLDYKEMEAILGVNANVLKVRTHRARELLRKSLGEGGDCSGRG